MQNLTCETCDFWSPYKDSWNGRVEIDRMQASKGECRRYPITRTAMEGDMFPTSKAKQWCGEHSAKRTR